MASFDRWVQNMKAREWEKGREYRVRSLILDCSYGDFSDFSELRRFDTDSTYHGRDWLMKQVAEALRVSMAEAAETYARWIVDAATKASSDENQ